MFHFYKLPKTSENTGMGHLLVTVQLVFLQKFFWLWFFSASTKPRTSAKSNTLKNQKLPPPPDSSNIDYYKNIE